MDKFYREQPAKKTGFAPFFAIQPERLAYLSNQFRRLLSRLARLDVLGYSTDLK
jgi:hypothetical protein